MISPLIEMRREPLSDEGWAAHVGFANAARLNVLSTPVMSAFVEVVEDVGRDADLRAVVLQGDARAFVGGADVDEMAAIASPDEARAFIGRVHACCAAVRACPVPVIAAISGWCLGAGLELAAACDLRIADESARLGMPEVKLGIPSVVEAALLPGLIGWGRTRELLLFGEVIDAREALRIGLVDQLVEASALESAVAARLGQLTTARPLAVRAQKALISRWEALGLEAAIAAGVDAFAAAFETDEPGHAMRDFQSARAARRRR
jgi:enoyl-CoA hydratase/carnithine racemase